MNIKEIKERVHKELMELDGNIGRLELLLHNKDKAKRAMISAHHWQLLTIQLASMKTYAECLAARLADFEEQLAQAPATPSENP